MSDDTLTDEPTPVAQALDPTKANRLQKGLDGGPRRDSAQAVETPTKPVTLEEHIAQANPNVTPGPFGHTPNEAARNSAQRGSGTKVPRRTKLQRDAASHAPLPSADVSSDAAANVPTARVEAAPTTQRPAGWFSLQRRSGDAQTTPQETTTDTQRPAGKVSTAMAQKTSNGESPMIQDDGLASPIALGAFPTIRSRRTRQADWMRRLVSENQLTVNDLIWPIFVQEENGATQIDGLPGVVRYGPDTVLPAINEAQELGIPAIALFPEVAAQLKTPTGDEAVNPENLVCRTLRRIKESFDDIGVIADVALDPYTNTGQDGIVDFSRNPEGEVLNDESVAALVDQSLLQAEAGCNIIAPSDMMDGRVGAIRRALDEAGYDDVAIMSYTAKYASAFYGPFRGAIGSQKMLTGNKKTYQMDPANAREAARQVALDIAEGADLLLVKPGLPYLDILKGIKDSFGLPTYAYQVSGEYAMMAAAAENGWLDGNAIMLESLLAFKRAGADGIWTYAALDVARELQA